MDLKERLEKLEALMTNQAAVGSEEAYKAIETVTANQSGSLHSPDKNPDMPPDEPSSGPPMQEPPKRKAGRHGRRRHDS